MKCTLLLFLVAILGIRGLMAQDVNITGRWEGYLDQSEAASKMEGYKIYWDEGVWRKGVKTHKLRLTFKAAKRNENSHEGEYYINDALNKAHYGRFAIKGTFRNGALHYETTSKIFEVKNRLNFGFCYSKATLKWSEDANYEYLEGTWKGWDEDGTPCADAHVRLRRRKRVPTPPVVEDTIPTPPPVEEPPVAVKEEPKEEAKSTPPPQPPVIPLGDPSLRRSVTKDQLHVDKDSIDIAVWDDNRADGDIISLVYNGKVLLKEYTLTKARQRFRVKLRPGKNVITLIAHNLGEIPPNTAAIEVERNEGRKRVILESDMDKSESIIIYKE